MQNHQSGKDTPNYMHNNLLPQQQKIYTTFAVGYLVMDIPRSYLLYLCELMVELIRHAKAIQQVQGLHCTEHIWDPGGDRLWFETCPLQVAV